MAQRVDERLPYLQKRSAIKPDTDRDNFAFMTSEGERERLSRSDIERILSAHPQGHDLYLSGADLRGEDLSGLETQPASTVAHELEPFADARMWLDHADVHGATLEEIDLRSACMEGIDAHGISEPYTDAHEIVDVVADAGGEPGAGVRERSGAVGNRRLDMRGQPGHITGQTCLHRAKLQHAHLEQANLSKACLRRAQLCHAWLQRADLNGCSLQEADLAQAHLEGSILRGARLHNANLSNAQLGPYTVNSHTTPTDLSGAHLDGAVLRGAQLRGAVLNHAWLRDAQLSGAKLQGAQLKGTHLENATLTGRVNLQGAQLVGAFLDGADLTGATLNGWRTDLTGASLQATSLRDAQLKKVILVRAQLQQAKLDNANLRGAHLVEANLEGAMMEGTDLRKADLTGAHLRGATLKGAKLYGRETRLAGADLQGVNLRYQDLGGVVLEGANLRGADLSGAYLGGANLTKAQMQGATLVGADLQGAQLKDADLQGAILTQAMLDGAILKRVNLTDANLEWANLQGADLREARLRGANFYEAWFDSNRSLSYPPADLQRAVLDVTTTMAHARLGNTVDGFVTVADTAWNDVNLATAAWAKLVDADGKLGDELAAEIQLRQIGSRSPRENHIACLTYHGRRFWYAARSRPLRHTLNAARSLGHVRWSRVSAPRSLGRGLRSCIGRLHHRPRPSPDGARALHACIDAARANRQLALAFAAQGLISEATVLDYRAHLWQHKVLQLTLGWKYPEYWVSSLLLVVSGYGYKVGRSVVTYAFLILLFTAANLWIAPLLPPHKTVPPGLALLLSILSFHGRGFIAGDITTKTSYSIIAAFEAVVGLVFEAIFIATLTRRLFR